MVFVKKTFAQETTNFLQPVDTLPAASRKKELPEQINFKKEKYNLMIR